MPSRWGKAPLFFPFHGCAHISQFIFQHLPKILLNDLAVAQAENRVLHLKRFEDGLSLVFTQVQKKIHWENIPSSVLCLRESLKWIGGFEEYLLQMPVGWMVQPTPTNNSTSNVFIRKLDSEEDLQAILPTLLRKEWGGGSYSQLVPPMRILWSTRTEKITFDLPKDIPLLRGTSSTGGFNVSVRSLIGISLNIFARIAVIPSEHSLICRNEEAAKSFKSKNPFNL